LRQRCEAAAELVSSHDDYSVIWCHLNDEGDLLEKIIPEAFQVKGSQSDERKEERLRAFSDGELKRLIIKPKIGAFGLNWQHCHNVVCFPGYSFEQYYQAVRRCWRFGQKREVDVTIIASAGEKKVLAAMKRKSEQADRMFDNLVSSMDDVLHVERKVKFKKGERIPQWLM